MAKDSKKKEEKTNKGPQPRRASWKVSLFLILSIIMAAVFLPSSVLLIFGLLPTFAALFADASRAKTKVVTVGALNLAGCTPFLLELWTEGNSLDKSLSIISDPKAIIVMYSAAAIGYLIDWSLSALVAGVLYQRGLARQDAIRKRQMELVERWGAEVTGQAPQDAQALGMGIPNKP